MLPNEPLKAEVNLFIQSPFPLWETQLANKLVQAVYHDLKIIGIDDRMSYHTASIWAKHKLIGEKQFLVSYGQQTIYLEKPDFSSLGSFYTEHGLSPLTEREIVKNRAATKLKKALNVLTAIPDCVNCISSLVNCTQAVCSEGPEYDVSYSHPNIPFTIFVSVCQDETSLSDIRVAESILHESMHLKLTLIEKCVPLVEPGSMETFYSPWRDEHRPLRGVIHGLFVFRAIFDFYQEAILETKIPEVKKFMHNRIVEIRNELRLLHDFPNAKGLTEEGQQLASSLLKIEWG